MDQKNLKIEFNTNELNELQVRLIKRVAAMLDHVMHTTSESEYFESSSELLRIVAQTIKNANFTKGTSEVDHAEQALQYCVDRLADQVYEDTLVKHDC